MKMAEVDINPFGKHNKIEAQPDTGETIPFIRRGVIEGISFWEPNKNKRHHLEEGV